jgi:hypothetical protein
VAFQRAAELLPVGLPTPPSGQRPDMDGFFGVGFSSEQQPYRADLFEFVGE